MAVATVYNDSDGVSIQKTPPKGKLTFFEENDVVAELINSSVITSPDETISITSTALGKEIQVNLGTSLIKNTTTSSADFGKIDVNFDGETIIQDSTTNALKVNHGDTLKESATSGEVGKLDVRTGNTIKVSDGTGTNPDAGTLDVKTGTSLTVADGTGTIDEGTIDVNIDNQSIKQYASNHATLPNKLYVNVDNASGLKLDSTNGIQVRLGKALGFRTGQTGASAGDNGLIDVKYDDNTIKYNSTNDNLYVDFNEGSTYASGYGSVTMERKSKTVSGTTTYYGWGVKHGSTISADSDGIHVNIDDVSIKQYPYNYETASLQNKLYINHDTTIVTDGTNGLGVNIDDKSIKQIASGNDAGKLYVNIDNLTIKEYASDYTTASLRDKLYVNIDGTTLISNDTTGVISVNPNNIAIYGENAIDVTNHTTSDVVDGKTVKLKINSNDKVLTQDANGLLTNLTISDVTNSETLPANVLKRYRLLGKNTAASGDPVYAQLGSAIDIYKDSSLIDAHLGHIGDTLKPSSQWAGSTPVYPTDYNVATTGNDALCFVYMLADGTYQLVTIDVESFLTESEFKDGLNVEGHEVSVKVWNGIELYEETSGENKSLRARIGDGIDFGSGTDGQKPIIARIGNGLQFNSSATSGQKPIELRLGGGLEYNTSETDGQRSVKIKVGTGIGIDTATGHVGELYVNYGTIGAANQPVYWDGTNHTPVAITHTIDADVPSDAVFTDTLYYSGNEITIDSTNNHINHDAKLGTAFTGTTAATTISGFGGSGTFKVPVFNVNEYGHVTSASEVEMAITMPENKITTYTAPTYTQGHLSQDWVTAYTNNAIVVNTDTFDSGINKLDNKIQVLADELSDAEATFSQAIEDEPRYFAKSTTATAASGTVALTATIVDNRAYNLFDGTKVDVYFQNDQSVSSATLAISGSNSSVTPVAKYLVYNDQLFNADLIEAGTTLALVYDAATITIGGVQYSGVYRVVGGVGSGSGSGSTNGITDINAGNGINVTKNYTEVTINSSATPYSSTWFTGVTPTSGTASDTVYRVTTPGNYYNMAYKWDGSKYVLSTDIEETVAVKLAANMIPEGSTSGSATEISGLGTLLKFTSSGELAMENTWDCGTY